MTRGSTVRWVAAAVGVAAVMTAAVGGGPAQGRPATVTPTVTQVSAAPPAMAPEVALAVAARCLDPRHVALVGNASRHGRVFSYADALAWCTR